jgi:colanic acid/amylovoran biosynthesis glycosyltransferase
MTGRGRIAMVVPVFPQVSETFIVAKFLGLLDRGWDVHVCCARSDEANWQRYPALLEREGVRERIHLGHPVRPAGAAVATVPRALRSLARAGVRPTVRVARGGASWRAGAVLAWTDLPVLALRPDVVHFEFLALAVGREQLAAACGARMVGSSRGSDVSTWALDRPRVYDGVWGALDSLHVLGGALWERARRRGCPPDLDHVAIPPAVDVERFRIDRAAAEPVGPDRPLRLLSVGRLEWKKGHEVALVAVRQLLDAGVPVDYRIIGGGAYEEALRWTRAELGLEGAVTLEGAVDHATVRERLAWADVLVHPSATEGFGNAVLEAQAAGIPVVCSDADGLPDNVEPGVTGIVVARRDPEALADALAALAADPARRDAMGAAGRARVAEHFTAAAQLDAFDAWYERVLARPRR